MGKHKSKTDHHNSQRTCVFCGKVPLSREEIWPYWVRKILPKDTFNSYRTSATTRISLWKKQYSTAIINKNGQLSRRQIKEFCENCNNGWMSRLESSVQEVLTPLIKKKDAQLSANDLYKILVWANLRIIILDVGEAVKIITQSERESFYNNRLPLDKLTVWFGKTDTSYPYYYAFETLNYSTVISNLHIRNTRAFIWMAGGFIIYAIYHNGPANFTTLWDHPNTKLFKLEVNNQPIDTGLISSMAEMEIDFLRLSFLKLQLMEDN